MTGSRTGRKQRCRKTVSPLQSKTKSPGSVKTSTSRRSSVSVFAPLIQNGRERNVTSNPRIVSQAGHEIRRKRDGNQERNFSLSQIAKTAAAKKTNASGWYGRRSEERRVGKEC